MCESGPGIQLICRSGYLKQVGRSSSSRISSSRSSSSSSCSSCSSCSSSSSSGSGSGGSSSNSLTLQRHCYLH